MNSNYNQKAILFKVLSDPNRLKIIDMISCDELCACELLEKLNITQSTLSHHMKILCNCELVNCRTDGKWTFYSINQNKVIKLKEFINDITNPTENCICDVKEVDYGE